MSLVVVTDSLMGPADVERPVVEAHGHELVQLACATEADLLERLPELEPAGLLVQFAPITRQVLEATPSVRAIARYGVGLDNIDLDAAASLDVRVRNVVDYATAEVADHALGLLISLVRSQFRDGVEVRSGTWPGTADTPAPSQFEGMAVGLFGFGRIARALAARLRALGAEVSAHDPYVSDEEVAAEGVRPIGWDTLWSSSAAVSIHAPLTDETLGAVDRSALAHCQAPIWLINVARGGLIDRSSFEDALETGVIAGAGLDVWWEEPPDPDDQLIRHPRVVVTPHTAWRSSGSEVRLRTKAAQAVVEELAGS